MEQFFIGFFLLFDWAALCGDQTAFRLTLPEAETETGGRITTPNYKRHGKVCHVLHGGNTRT